MTRSNHNDHNEGGATCDYCGGRFSPNPNLETVICFPCAYGLKYGKE